MGKHSPLIDPNKINDRVQLIYFGLLIGLLAIATRSAYLQVWDVERYQKLASAQQEKEIYFAGKRGVITDRHGHKMAIDLKAYSIYVDPEYLKDPAQDVAKKLSPVLGIAPDVLTKKLSSNYWRYLIRKVDEETAKAVRELKLPGIGVISENKRDYPQNHLAASLIGFTNIDNKGQEGVEKSFDNVLKGGRTAAKILTDAYGHELLRVDGNLPFLTEKTKANTVVLTIDQNIQHIVERELDKGMKNTKSKRGTAIVMDLKNGDLVALATNPSIDLNQIAERGWDPRVKNWAVTDQYEPGSTMKIFTVAAALEAGKTSPTESIACPTLVKIDGWPLVDHHQPPGRVRMLTPFRIMELSSNVGSSILGRRMSDEKHRELLLKFGFGKRTQSQLNGEVKGNLPQLPWPAVRQSTISFGHGVTVTPLQVVTAASAIANKGIRVEPRIIHQILSPDKKVIKEYPPVKTRTVSEKTARQMMEMMTQVVESKYGTAHSAKIPGYVLGGKTGTADKPKGRGYGSDVMSSFVGALPADDPKYVIFVLFDSPQTAHYASLTAVPVFREIARNIIYYDGIQPSRPEEIKSIR